MADRSSAGHRWAAAWLAVATAAAAVAAVVGLAAGWWWVADLTRHFRPHLAAALAVALLAALGLGSRRTALVAAAALAVQLAGLLAPLPTPPQVPAAAPRLTAVTFNVNTTNTESSELDCVVDYLRATDPEVAVVVEVGHPWWNALERLAPRFRVIGRPDENNFGIALVTRLPLTQAALVDLDGSGRPSVTATARWAGRPLEVLGVHAMSPTSAADAAGRDRLLAAMAAWAAPGGRRMVLGDFNATLWSAPFSRALAAGGLAVDGGRLPRPTWPALLGPLGIAVDHVLVTDGLAVASRRLGPACGSDHRALEVVVAPVAGGG